MKPIPVDDYEKRAAEVHAARRRTAYQDEIVKGIRAFCPPRPKKDEAPLTKEQTASFLLRPAETVLMRDGTVVVNWWVFAVVATKKQLVWLNYAEVEKARASNTAFGVFLDWCDERGLRYGKVNNRDLPGARYRNPSHGYHFRVTIPRRGV